MMAMKCWCQCRTTRSGQQLLISGGTAIHYKCDEENFWYPDIADMESKITPNTRGIVVINPNNPTGSVYPRHVLEQIVALAKNMT